MKIAPKETETFLGQPGVCRAVLLYGPDAGLARERARRLKELVVGKDADPFALVELTEASLLEDEAKLTDELLAISMMAPKRVIVVRDASDKSAPVIREACNHLNDSVFLVIIAGELTPRSGLRAWFEEAPRVAALACYRDEIRDVQDVIRKSLSQAGIDVTRDVMDYLSQQLGNDRYVTYQELEKIITFAGNDKRLSMDDAQALVDYNRDTQLDDIIVPLADKSLQAFDKALQILIRDGTQPIIYLRALMRYFYRLYFIRSQMAAGRSMEEVIRGLKPKVFFRQEQSLKRHVQNWDKSHIVKAIQLLISAELACKSSDLPSIAASSRKLMQVTQIR